MRRWLSLALLSCLALFPGESPALDAKALFEKVAPSTASLRQYFENNTYRNGACFYVREDVVCTNHHVVAGDLAKGIVRQELVQHNGTVLPVLDVLAMDEQLDLALLLVPPSGIPLPLQVNDPPLGLEVLVIGNPKGFVHSASTGVVGSIFLSPHNNVPTYHITAFTTHGNSGGPVITPSGEVVAVHFAGQPMENGVRLGLARPAYFVARMLAQPNARLSWFKEDRRQDPSLEGASRSPATPARPARPPRIQQGADGVILIR